MARTRLPAATRRYLAQIQGFRSSPHLQWDLLVTVHDGLPTELALGRSREHLAEVVETQLGLLADLPATEVRDDWRRSLEDLRSYLRGTDDIGLDDLASDPRLAKIVECRGGTVSDFVRKAIDEREQEIAVAEWDALVDDLQGAATLAPTDDELDELLDDPQCPELEEHHAK